MTYRVVCHPLSVFLIMPNRVAQNRPLTDEWRDAANAELDRRGRGSRAALARAVGIKKATLTNILSTPKYKTSDHVESISKELGLYLPPLSAGSEVAERFMQYASTLTEAQLEDLCRIAAQLEAANKKSE